MAGLSLQNWRLTGAPIQLLWGESQLTITPALHDLTQLLTIDVKVMQQHKTKPWIRKTVKHRKPMYTLLDLPQKIELTVPLESEDLLPGMSGVGRTKRVKIYAMWTHHGFIDDVCKALQEWGIPYQISDARLANFPAPRFDQMHGFRFSQRELLESALRQNKSGLIGAPTRYGKTTLLINTLRAYAGMRVLVVAPGVDLIDQLYEDIKTALPHLEVKKVHGGVDNKKPCRHITVLSADSMDAIDPAYPQLILMDEPHALPTDSRMPNFVKFDKSRKIGFGATLDGRFDGKDPMIKGLIGPVLAERTYLEGVAEGAIAPIVILMLEVPMRPFDSKNRNKAYHEGFWQAEHIANTLGWMLGGVASDGQPVFPPDWQILGFIDNEKQIDFLSERLDTWNIPHDVAMAKNMTKKIRKSKTADLKSGETRLAFATKIFAQGVTFSNLRVVLNLTGGGASTSTIQKPGRVAEIIEGKRCGVVVDFFFRFPEDAFVTHRGSECFALSRESQVRLDYYVERGFEVYRVKTPDEMVRVIRGRCQ